MDKMKILVVDDESRMRKLVHDFLARNNYDVIEAANGEEALDIFYEDKDIALIILDVMMPDMDGFELCKLIKSTFETSHIPVILLTSLCDKSDQLEGLGLGAEDYITKPFDNTELVLKIKSHLRLQSRSKASKNIITIGEISINKESFEVYKNNKRVEVSTREFELLTYLMENAGIALSKEQIFEKVWGNCYGDIGTVAVNIKNLREKLDQENKYIITIWGYGYKFVRN